MLRIANGFTTVSDRQRNHLTETAETINETTAKPRVKLPVKPRNRLLRREGDSFAPLWGSEYRARHGCASATLRWPGARSCQCNKISAHSVQQTVRSTASISSRSTATTEHRQHAGKPRSIG